jgi:NADH:ubiquinone oxidoreductase subunit F (NADH-binding)
MLEGLAIAASVIEAKEIFIYIRGEYTNEHRAIELAIEDAKDSLQDFEFVIVKGHGAYICGEETALLESLEGKRGMPRLKPPYPTESGFRGKPSLIHNVETIACVPAIIHRGGEWFRSLGRTEAGSKLYCISGHVVAPGVYELPLGVSLDELVEASGGYVGNPVAFSPGGASSGFLPISKRRLPLDYKHLADAGSMLGSAGVVVINDTVDMAKAAAWQLEFFERESCGQCAPCRIGTQYIRRQVDQFIQLGDPATLEMTDDVGWEMEEGSICGLGMVAAKPLESARKHFPDAFKARD